MSMRALSAIGVVTIALLFPGSLLASDQLSVVAGQGVQLDGGKGLTEIGGVVLLENASNLKFVPIGLVKVVTRAANVEVSVSDQQRFPVEVQSLGDGYYLIRKPGKYWIDVTAIDFTANIYSRKTVVVEVGNGPNPPPTPDPPGPEPGPGPSPTPDNVPDAYGLGKVAYSAAPRGSAMELNKHKEIFRQAADFLYGIPTMKFVETSRREHGGDPNRSVQAWMRQEFGRIQCTDQTTCQAWAAWRAAVDKALTASQQRRQYSRSDWYQAFREIVTALEMVK